MLKGRSYLVKKPEYILTDMTSRMGRILGEVQYVRERKLLKVEGKA